MRIFITKRADKNFHSIKERIAVSYGGRVAEAFELKTVNFLDILEKFPEIGSVEVTEKQIRGFQLTKQTRVFYRIKGERIIILTFFDVRQDPKKKPGN
jgi:plasmid stabilization system protein ParE